MTRLGIERPELALINQYVMCADYVRCYIQLWGYKNAQGKVLVTYELCSPTCVLKLCVFIYSKSLSLFLFLWK